MKYSILFSSLFLVLTLLSAIQVQTVDAVSYYNLLQNPSFTTYSEYIEDGSFESALWLQGSEYGDWNVTDDGIGEVYITNSVPVHTGVYSLYQSGGNSATEYAYYNLTYSGEVLGADIFNFTFWTYGDYSGDQLYVRFCYTDATFDTATVTIASGSWTQHCVVDDIDDSKYLYQIRFIDTDADACYYEIDDVSMLVDDGDAQSDMDFGSEPWMSGGYSVLGVTVSIVDRVGFTSGSGVGRIDNYCAYISQSDGYYIMQWVDQIAVEEVRYINVYVKSSIGSTMEIQLNVRYTDGTADVRYEDYACDGTWTEINFGHSFLDDGKYIDAIAFGVEDPDGTLGIGDDFGGSMLFDDAGLWCSEPSYNSRFDYSVSPSPIEKAYTYCKIYNYQPYTFTFYFYNVTDGGLDANGTYLISTDFGMVNGSMTLGTFSVQLAKRTYATSPYEVEIMSILISTSTETYRTDITMFFYPVSGDGSASDGGVTSEWRSTGDVSNFFTIFAVIGLPAFVIGAVTKSPMGMVAGLVLGVGAGYMATMIDMWAVFLFGVAMVTLFLASWKMR